MESFSRTFYVNGKIVKNPLVGLNSWVTIGIVFNFALDFTATIGSFNVVGPIIFNNLSHYQSSLRDTLESVGYRKWYGVLGENLLWSYWLGTVPNLKLWRDILFTNTSDFTEIDGAETYKKLTGADRFVIDTDSTFVINKYRYLVYEAIGWQSNVVTSA